MEDYADVFNKYFRITIRYSQVFESNVTRDWQQFMETFAMFLAQQLKNLAW